MKWTVWGLRAAAAVRKMSPFLPKLREMRKFAHTKEHLTFSPHSVFITLFINASSSSLYIAVLVVVVVFGTCIASRLVFGIDYDFCFAWAIIWKLKSSGTKQCYNKEVFPTRTYTEGSKLDKVRYRWDLEPIKGWKSDQRAKLNISEEKCRNARSLLLSAGLCWLLISSVCPDEEGRGYKGRHPQKNSNVF